MFNLFKKSSASKVVDKVWMSTEAKWKACADMLSLNPACLFVAWFPETFNDLSGYLGSDTNITTAEKIKSEVTYGRMLIFVEHYPLPSVEQELFNMLALKEVPVLVAMDEPFFAKFGGEKTIELMKRLGVGDNEVLGHSMITKSIRRAQEKLAAKVKFEKKANSQQEWMDINIG